MHCINININISHPYSQICFLDLSVLVFRMCTDLDTELYFILTGHKSYSGDTLQRILHVFINKNKYQKYGSAIVGS